MEDVVPRDWEPILTLHLPKKPSLRILEAVRGQVLLYLDWIMNDLIQVDDASTVRREIERATDRLLKVAAALPGAMDAEAERRDTSIDPKKLARVTRWLSELEDDETNEHQFVADSDLT